MNKNISDINNLTEKGSQFTRAVPHPESGGQNSHIFNIIDSQIIQSSNHKPTLINHLFAFDEDGILDKNNLSFLNQQLRSSNAQAFDFTPPHGNFSMPSYPLISPVYERSLDIQDFPITKQRKGSTNIIYGNNEGYSLGLNQGDHQNSMRESPDNSKRSLFKEFGLEQSIFKIGLDAQNLSPQLDKAAMYAQKDEVKNDDLEFEDEDEERFHNSEDNRSSHQDKMYNEDENNKADNNINEVAKENQYVCDYDECKKVFKAKKSLLDHLRIHTNERPYNCQEAHCGKAFIQFSSLQKHQRTHKGDRPYKCDHLDCDQSFTQVSNLKRHFKIHLNDKPFECDLCIRKFTTLSNLKQHQIIHENQKERQRFMCPIDECGKSYLYSSSLKKHEKEHILNNNFPRVSQLGVVGVGSGGGLLTKPCDIHQEKQEITNKIDNKIHSDVSEEENIVSPVEEGECQHKRMDDTCGGVDRLEKKESKCNHGQEHQHFDINKSNDKCIEKNSNSTKGDHHSDMDMLSIFFTSHHVALQHDGHYDVLFKGYLYHYNKKTGKIEIHDIQAQDEIKKGTCQPLCETSHGQGEENSKRSEEIHKRGDEKPQKIQNTTQININDDQTKYSYQNNTDQICESCEGVNAQLVCCDNSNCSQQELIEGQLCCGTDLPHTFGTNETDILVDQIKQIHDTRVNVSNEEPVKTEECGCSIDIIKIECTCVECYGDCHSCSLFNKGKLNETFGMNTNHIALQEELPNNVPNKDSLQGNSLNTNDNNSRQPTPLDHEQKCTCYDGKDIKHLHGPNCGHIPIYHQGHLDYLVENQLHHPHGTHCDFHGTVSVLDNINKF